MVAEGRRSNNNKSIIDFFEINLPYDTNELLPSVMVKIIDIPLEN